MRASRSLPAIAFVLVVLLLPVAAPSEAATCGDRDPATQLPRKATLTLDEDSVATIAYGRDMDDQTLLLRFRAAGCTFGSDQAAPAVDLLPKQGEEELPGGTVSLLRSRRDGSEFAVRLAVNPARFDPGTYGGFVELSAPDVATTRTPVTISRSEDKVTWPVGMGVIGGLAGLLWLWLLSIAKGALLGRVSVLHYFGVFVAAAVAGVVSVFAQYLDQEVWSVGENGLAALTAAFTGASTGAMITMIGVLWKPDGQPAAAEGGAGGAKATAVVADPRPAQAHGKPAATRGGRFPRDRGRPKESAPGTPPGDPLEAPEDGPNAR